jgi:P-type Cu+ transporter
MTVSIAGARDTAENEGRTYYFCGSGCRSRFEVDPARYLATA